MTQQNFEKWLEKATLDDDLINELIDIKDSPLEIKDRFYKNLEFGTAGLRGVIGAGTNRMNIYTVGAATQGLAEYILSQNKNGSVAIAYDSRIKSKLFAHHSARIFAANGVKVYIYPELMPVPMLSFAVRHLKCDAGVVITASHNPAKYNGYKAYGPDGSQLSPAASEYVLSIINRVDIFEGVRLCDFDNAVDEGLINFIGNDVISAYLDAVLEQSVADESYDFSKLKVIYSPLHGAGNKPVREALKRIGAKNVSIVKEQELPDGNFPTLPFPNPEFKEAFDLALSYAKNNKADLLLATDPDCDRVGIAVRVNDEYKLITGNEVGALLLNYLLERKSALGKLPENPVCVKTIVTTNLVKCICDDYGTELKNVLTGFKFIGEQIYLLEERNEAERFILGFEESYGYLAGSYVRDKDAVLASMLICEMCCYSINKGKTLFDVLSDLYEKYGYFYNRQKSITCEGLDGMEKMAASLKNLRNNPPKSVCGFNVDALSDYLVSEKTDTKTGKKTKILLPKADVLCYDFENGAEVIIRPSGTEPKIKIYISAIGSSTKEGILLADKLQKAFEELLNL